MIEACIVCRVARRRFVEQLHLKYPAPIHAPFVRPQLASP